MKKIMLLIFCCFILFYSLTGQEDYTTKSKKAIGLYHNAGREYQLLNYSRSIEFLRAALKTDSEFIEAWLLLAQVCTDAGLIEESIDAYRTAIGIDPGYFPPASYLLARNEFSIGQYQQAREDMKIFLSLGYGSVEMKQNATKLIKYCDFSIKVVAHPVPFEPVNLGPNINTRYDEYWPSLSADESILVFTVQIPIDANNPRVYMNRQEDFYFSEYQNGEWQPAKNAGYPPNTEKNEGAQTISADGKHLFFTACNLIGGLGKCDLYYSERKGDRWSVPENLGRPVNTGNNEKQPSVSADGRVLFFVSDRAGGKGEFDVWISHRNDDGTWMEPVNAGDSINTTGDEQSPFIHPDNQTLYFASTGWPGLGRYDIYLSKRKTDDTWSTPVNLGYPINTFNNEEGLIVNAAGNTAYFSSDRIAGQGRDLYKFDLYEDVRPVKVSYMKGKVYDAETWQRLQARFELIDLNTGEVVMMSFSEPGSGEFLVCIPASTDYALNVSKKGYLFFSEHFSLEKVYERNEPYLKDIPLQPIKIGETIILRNIFYAYNSYKLEDRSKIELDKVIQLMKENPLLVIEISGHTDNTGTPEYNQGLSEKRAVSVKTYLSEHGISPVRMTAVGYGLTKPIASNDTEDGRSENRRTELKILEK
jgi:outer membrane protein OmpA-like peptidoglycan-associated protein/Tol biopolymer transport system component